jgi:hypothetical protein
MAKTYIFVWEPGEKKQKDIYNRILKFVNEKQLRFIPANSSGWSGRHRSSGSSLRM